MGTTLRDSGVTDGLRNLLGPSKFLGLVVLNRTSLPLDITQNSNDANILHLGV